MEVPTTLLVALMFVTVLTLGIANLLGALSSAAVTGRQTREGFPLFSWKILLLLMHLSTFWGTREIATFEWGFVGFLYILAGPILLLLATTTLLSSETAEGDDNATRLFRRTFIVIGLLQVWVLSTVLMLGGTLGPADWSNFAVLAIAAYMVMCRPAGWRAGTIVGWIVLGISLAMRGSGMLS